MLKLGLYLSVLMFCSGIAMADLLNPSPPMQILRAPSGSGGSMNKAANSMNQKHDGSISLYDTEDMKQINQGGSMAMSCLKGGISRKWCMNNGYTVPAK